MDGVHDLAGKQGFGKVRHQINTDSYKPVFKEDWEHLAYGLLFVGADPMGAFSIDELRHAVERIEPVHYLATPYYERYIIGTASLLVEKGILTQEELEELAGGPFPLALPTGPGRPTPETAPFEVGDRVRVKNEFVPGHIRQPAFVRGKTGTVLHRTTDKWPFPDSIGHGMDAGVQPTYHVSFDSHDLWGDDTDGDKVIVDLFEGYLEKV